MAAIGKFIPFAQNGGIGPDSGLSPACAVALS
jgi:hypothetical protein